MKLAKTKPRQYRRITAETIAKHRALAIIHGNGSSAVRALSNDYRNLGDRAYRIQKKSETMPTQAYLNESMEQIAGEAIQELGELVHSADERIRTKNVHYAIDHVRGKATQKSISITGKLNIQSVLD